MNYRKLLFRSLKFYRKIHLRVALGTMISTAILVGALVIGDSVKFSLRQIVFDRLGKTEFALSSGDRFFRARMADELSQILDAPVAPLLQTKGIAIAGGGEHRANNIQIIGVDSRFGEIAGVKNFYDNISPDEVIINTRLASRLNLKKGDELLLRIKKLDVIPVDAPLSLDSELTIAKRFKIKDIAADDKFGRFNLKANQVAPNTAFVSLLTLSQDMGFKSRANVLLAADGNNNSAPTTGKTGSKQKFFGGPGGDFSKKPPGRRRQIDEAFKKTWTLTDTGLEIRELPALDMVEIKSSRIFLESHIVKAALKIDKNARQVLTYFVNELSLGNKSTPYSFVSAAGTPIVPPDMRDDEILINRWLADDLSASTGDRIRLTYYVLGPMRDLIEKSAYFKIKRIVPIDAPYSDKDLMPDFPGLSGEQGCRDWHPGIPIDLDRIREKDEDYWDDYRGTPKAFITLKAGQEMWRNRFGNLTALRFTGLAKKDIEKKLMQALQPENFGFVFRDVKQEGLRASTESVDFAQLFLGLSFFIIIAALLLTGLLYGFNVEQRSRENGLLFAVGFRRKDVRRFVLMEGAVIIFIGSLLGSAAGVLYNQVLLQALKTVWHGVVGTSALHIHLKFSTISLGTAAGIIIAFFVVWLVAWRQAKHPITSLQRGITKLETYRDKKPRLSLIIGISGVLAVIIILAVTRFETGRGAFMFFFTAGIMLLISGLAFIRVLLYKIKKRANAVKLNLFNIGVRSNVRRPVRSLTLIALLASGLFIVFTVGANRNTAAKNAEKRESGTGGFSLYGESSMPIIYDLNSPKGSSFYGLENLREKGVSYVQLRVKEGDDASCLNLNRVANPRLIGINPGELDKRGAFTFVKKTAEVNPQNPWSVLKQQLPGGSVPAVADQTVILWGLGKAVGDMLTYRDENGRPFKIKLVGGLANSIFQGSIILSEQAIMQKYPSLSGYRLFLVDTPDLLAETLQELSWALQDQGLDLQLAADRLADFSQVENTYLAIFLILGSFGLILGSIGIGIVVWRNVKERQGELALLRAVGFKGKAIQKMVLYEHIVILAAGIGWGIAAALLATLPSIMTPGSGIPYITIILLLLIVLLNGFGWTYSATRAAVKGDLLAALRNE